AKTVSGRSEADNVEFLAGVGFVGGPFEGLGSLLFRLVQEFPRQLDSSERCRRVEIKRSPVVRKEVRNVQIPRVKRYLKRRTVAIIFYIRIGTMLQQQFYALPVVVSRRF